MYLACADSGCRLPGQTFPEDNVLGLCRLRLSSSMSDISRRFPEDNVLGLCGLRLSSSWSDIPRRQCTWLVRTRVVVFQVRHSQKTMYLACVDSGCRLQGQTFSEDNVLGLCGLGLSSSRSDILRRQCTWLVRTWVVVFQVRHSQKTMYLACVDSGCRLPCQIFPEYNALGLCGLRLSSSRSDILRRQCTWLV